MDCTACHKPNVDGARFCAACGALLPAASAGDGDSLVGQIIGGRYRITQLLGEGGMGRVYLGEQQMGTNVRKVAVKTLQAQFTKDPQVVARFHRECGTVSELEHPNTIQFFDFGQTPDGQLYIAMEFVQGESVSDALKRGPMPPDRAVQILAQICGSLEEAHSRGVIHRDLKPDNIILTQRAGRPDFVKVLDFGIAKRSEAKDQAQEQKLTQQGMVLGTPPYMSPEQFTGKQLDPRSDIYSLGVMAYEMLTGRLPFDADTPWQWATQHLTAQPIPFESLATAAAIPQPLKAVILRALAKEPEGRQASVHQFYEEITGVAPVAGPAGLGSGKTAAMPAAAQPAGSRTADMPAAQVAAIGISAAGATPAAGFAAQGLQQPFAPVLPAAQPMGGASSRGGGKGLIIALASVAGLLAIAAVIVVARSMKPKEEVVVENPVGATTAAATATATAAPTAAAEIAAPAVAAPGTPRPSTAKPTDAAARPKAGSAAASASGAPAVSAQPAPPAVRGDAACSEASRLASNGNIIGAVKAYDGCVGSPGAAGAKAAIQREAPGAVQAKIFNADCNGARAIVQAASSIGAGGPATARIDQAPQCKK